MRVLTGHTDLIRSVAWSPDGRYLASGSADRRIIIWDVQKGEELRVLNGHIDLIRSVAWSPDGRYLASGSADRRIIIWDVQKGEELRVLTGHTDLIRSVAWLPDGRYLASGSDDRRIIIWNVHQGEVLKTLTGHTDRVWSVALVPDGHLLASASADRKIQLLPMVFIAHPCKWIIVQNLNLAEWQTYRGLAAYRSTCPDLSMSVISPISWKYIVFTQKGRLLLLKVISGLVIIFVLWKGLR